MDHEMEELEGGCWRRQSGAACTEEQVGCSSKTPRRRLQLGNSLTPGLQTQAVARLIWGKIRAKMSKGTCDQPRFAPALGISRAEDESHESVPLTRNSHRYTREIVNEWVCMRLGRRGGKKPQYERNLTAAMSLNGCTGKSPVNCKWFAFNENAGHGRVGC